MIVSFTDDIRSLLLGIGQPPEPVTKSSFTVMTPHGPEKVEDQSTSRSDPLPSIMIEEVPNWLRDALSQGSHVVMPYEDFLALPEEVKEHATILSG
jgi:hypothetical protein